MLTPQPAASSDVAPTSPDALVEREPFRVWIDQDLCTGDGLCMDVVPEVFTLLEDGIAYVCEDGVVLNDPGMSESQAHVPEKHEEAVVSAALICPGECIFIER